MKDRGKRVFRGISIQGRQHIPTVVAQLRCCLRVGGGRGQGGQEKSKQDPATDGDFVKRAHALIPFTFKLLSLAKGQPPYSASFRKPIFPVSGNCYLIGTVCRGITVGFHCIAACFAFVNFVDSSFMALMQEKLRVSRKNVDIFPLAGRFRGVLGAMKSIGTK